MAADELGRETIERKAKAMYTAGTVVAPLWEQLGEITKSVWREKAAEVLGRSLAQAEPAAEQPGLEGREDTAMADQGNLF